MNAQLDLAILANSARRAPRCPQCNGPVFRNALPGRPNVDRIRAECSYCDWRVDMEFPAGDPDKAQIIDPDKQPDPARSIPLGGLESHEDHQHHERKRNAMPKGQPLKHRLPKPEYRRWVSCGRPDMDQWIAAGKPTKKQWRAAPSNHVDAAPAASSESNLKETHPDCAAPDAKPTPDPEPQPVSGRTMVAEFQQVVLPANTTEIYFALLGSCVTITTAEGVVIEQLPLET